MCYLLQSLDLRKEWEGVFHPLINDTLLYCRQMAWYHPSWPFYPGILFQMHNPTLDWQGPVACHLLAMFVTRACTSRSRSLMLGTPLITHSDSAVKESLSHDLPPLYSIPQEQISLDISNWEENQLCGPFIAFVNSHQIVLFQAEINVCFWMMQKSAWIKTEQLLDVCFANASLWISYRAQQKSNLYRSSSQQKKLQSICQVEPKSNLFV